MIALIPDEVKTSSGSVSRKFLGAVSICQVPNQLSGKLVNVRASEVIELLSLEIEDGRAKDDRYVDTTAVEYFSVHDLSLLAGHADRRSTTAIVRGRGTWRAGDSLPSQNAPAAFLES